MPAANEHKEKAEHHLRFLGTITDEFPDWMVTVAFYAAVELIEQFFADRGLHSLSHEDRNRGVLRNFPAIHKAYRALYNASLDVRYLSKEHWIPAAEVKRELIDRRLRHIQSFTASHASETEPLP